MIYMKKTIASLLLVITCVTAYSQKITFVPQWTPQAQFAGYYMALEKGFYADEGLDVDIRHIGVNSTETAMGLIMNGEAQIGGLQLIQALVARADGTPLLNVMQLTQKSGLWCVSRNPISKPEDLDRLKVGRWKVGFSEFCDIIECYKGIKVNWVPFINGINLYVFGAVDATLCYSYSEFIALKLAMGNIPENQILKFSEFGYDCPEDGVYVTEEYYAGNKETVDKFVRASKKGWDYAREHRKEALDLVMRYCNQFHIVTNIAHQTMMLDEYFGLQVNPSNGNVDYAMVSRSVFNEIVGALLNTGYITRQLKYEEIIR